MTDKNMTEMIFVMDMSTSMHSLKGDTIGGFNSMIEDQKKVDAKIGTKTKITTILFDTNVMTLHDGIDIQDIKEMTEDDYHPQGWTSLYDGIGSAIDKVGERLALTDEDKRADKIAFFVITDGEENHSRKYNQIRIKEMIEHQEKKYSWIFNFMGANQDSVLIASNLGFSAKSIANVDVSGAGSRAVYKTSSTRMSMMKRCVDYDASSFLSQSQDLQTSYAIALTEESSSDNV